jgi:hypothetical protein
VYIAGTTQGLMPVAVDSAAPAGTSAFLMKFHVISMKPVWTKQLGSISASRFHKGIARGMACAVTPNGESVWLGGVVEDNGVIENESSGRTKSHGGKDIFVAKIDTYNGHLSMVKQMGTAKDDQLARRGGLVADTDGNAVVIGNTYGSFYRTRSPNETASDVFVLTVSLFTGETVASAGAATKQASGGGVAGTVLLLSALVAVVAVGGLYLSRRFKGQAATDRSEVTTYLGGFDIEDVELKHSATGGWHCNFINGLSHGKYVSRNAAQRPPLSAHNSGEMPDALMRVPLTDIASTADKEFMFCDADETEDTLDSSSRSTSSLLHGGEPGSVYGDLVEAYNSTWEGRSRKRGTAAPLDNNTTPSAWGKDII